MKPFRDAPYLEGLTTRSVATSVANAIDGYFHEQMGVDEAVWVEPYKKGWAVRFGAYRVLLVRGDDGKSRR